MSSPTANDKRRRREHTRRLEKAKYVLEKHGYNVDLEQCDTYDRLIVDRIFGTGKAEKVSLEHVRECLAVNGLGLMFVERHSNLMASVDDVRNPMVKKKGRK
jgi:hypothetical protein